MKTISKEDKKAIIEDFLDWCFLKYNVDLMHYEDYEYCYADDDKLLKEYLSE